MGGTFAGVIGLLVGFPALRIKGIFLAMVTLAFGEIVRNFFMNFLAPLTGGAYGFRGSEIPPISLILDLGMVLPSSCFFSFSCPVRVGG